jgi:hypothetical protein
LWLNSPDLDAFLLFYQLRDTTRRTHAEFDAAETPTKPSDSG